MKRIARTLCTLLLASISAHAGADAPKNQCSHRITHAVATATRIDPQLHQPGEPLKFKVYATGNVTYTHKDGTTTKEIVNLDQGAIVLVGKADAPEHQTAKKMAKQLLAQQADKKLAQLCENKQCSKK